MCPNQTLFPKADAGSDFTSGSQFDDPYPKPCISYRSPVGLIQEAGVKSHSAS